MRPIKMIIENFGPFEQTEMDFERYEHQVDSSLFLITGQTGSGKTTLFDALCFALYGATSGGKRDPKEMRSQFATTEETQVTLHFEAQGKTFSVTRKPEQLLPKKKKDGFTKRAPMARLVEYQGSQKVASDEGIQVVNQKIYELIQLSLEEFSQIVLLPQGEFRRFLTSDSNQKEEVLRNLFQTSDYQKLTQELSQQYKTKEKDYFLLEQKQKLLLEDILQTSKEEVNLEDFLNKKEEEKQQAKVLFEQSEKQLQQQEQTYQKEKEQEKKRQELALEQEKMVDLSSQQSAIEKTQKEIEQLQQALQLFPYEKAYQELETQLLLKEQKKDDLKKALKEQQAKIELLEKNFQQQLAKEPEIQEIEKEKNHLVEAKDLYENYQCWQEELVSLTKETEKLQKEEEHLQESLVQKEEALKEIGQLLIKQSQSLKKQPELLEEKEEVDLRTKKLNAYLELVAQMKQDEKNLANTKEELEKVRDEQNLLEEKLENLKNQQRIIEISRLVSELKDGTPCPVCGSTEHPKPYVATSLEEKNLLNDQKKAQQALNKVTKQVLQLQGEKERFEDLLENERKQQEEFLLEPQLLMDTTHPNDLTKRRVELIEALEELKKVYANHNKLQQEQQDLDETIQNERKHWQEVSQHVQRKRNDQEVKKGQVELLKAKVKEKYLDRPIASYLAEMTAEMEQFKENLQQLQTKKTTAQEENIRLETTLNELKDQWLQTKENLEEKKRIFKDELVKCALSKEDYQRLIIKREDLSQMQQDVKSYEEKLHQTKGKIQQLEKEVTTTPLHLKELQEEILNIKESFQERQDEYYRLKNLVVTLKEKVKTSAELTKKMSIAMEELANLKEISDVAKGEKPYPFSLERYVLQYQFREVLDKANEKLHYLSKGRYALVLNEDENKAKKYSGLELDIYDDYTGAKRRVQTLSGGESFIAALSLSIALGEVIQMRAGGIHIDLLLIDEGFGTLDEEALKMSIDALESLETNGRTIGIISHVKELRQRIPLKLQVLSLENGRSCLKNLPLAGEKE